MEKHTIPFSLFLCFLFKMIYMDKVYFSNPKQFMTKGPLYVSDRRVLMPGFVLVMVRSSCVYVVVDFAT